MAIRQDNSILIDLPSIEQFNTRVAIRSFLLNQWILEEYQTKYRYFVETLTDGTQIYLERPGRLNKGCDFIIYITDSHRWKNGNDRPPKFDFILADLIQKKNTISLQQWESLLGAITSIYNCETYGKASPLLNGLPNVGYNYELVLKLMRWFFIEQDITYWSGKGRDMLYDVIKEL